MDGSDEVMSHMYHTDGTLSVLLFAGMHAGTRQEEVIDHRLTDREWAEEWKHLDHVRKVITFFYYFTSNNNLV